MTEKTRARVALLALVASGLAVSGCVSSPTYGTDKTSTEQLVGDVTGILSVAPKNREKIDYKPRPELVRPKPGENLNLPAPQENIVTASNSAWPESPEQRRSRMRAEATANRDNPGWEPEIQGDLNAPSSARSLPLGVSQRTQDSGLGKPGMERDQREAFNKRLAETRQGNPTVRKYLSEPPLDYRQPSASAPSGDIGEDEYKKERRLKAAAGKKGSWRDILPW
ncbi:hypothetical protein [Pseudaminobacter salicylatoxidans]|uniref:hypothetical protein n=1 Tax=Pseudaminobacter salicylatoxidans TaxID=93369 RepID=UPI0002E79EB0|nr:hypothetical protein [Pseudaminobacter salicylatoxidans]